jgi:hypothetical protein
MFRLDAPPALATAESVGATKPASWFFVFAIGAITIVLSALLALGLVISGNLGFEIAAPFLAGLAPAVIFSRRCPAAAAAILFITALPIMGIVWLTDVAPIGRIVALADAASVPTDRDVAGYQAPGWRIDTAHKEESQIHVRRGGVGVRTVAPLLAPASAPHDPVALWVVGYAYHSGKIGPRHPAHWTEPGEFARLVGADLGEAQDAALHAAAAQGLATAPAPIMVVRVDDALASERAQAATLIKILLTILGLWLVVSFASVRLEARAAKRRSRN